MSARRSSTSPTKVYNTPDRDHRAEGREVRRGAEELKGKTIGVQVSTTHQNYVEKHYVPAGAKFKTYQTQDEANQDLAAGRSSGAGQFHSARCLPQPIRARPVATRRAMCRRILRFRPRRRRRYPQGRHGAARQAQRGHQEGPRIGRVRHDNQEVFRLRHLRGLIDRHRRSPGRRLGSERADPPSEGSRGPVWPKGASREGRPCDPGRRSSISSPSRRLAGEETSPRRRQHGADRDRRLSLGLALGMAGGRSPSCPTTGCCH